MFTKRKALLYSLAIILTVTGCTPRPRQPLTPTAQPTQIANTTDKQIKLDTFDLPSTKPTTKPSNTIAPTTQPTQNPTTQPIVTPQACVPAPLPPYNPDPSRLCYPHRPIDGFQDNCTCAYGNWLREQVCTPESYNRLNICREFGLTCTRVRFCHAKPIVYLYPTEPTLVDVLLEIPGTIPISDPLYPVGGWQNILAQPNGDLWYAGKQYPYLYYESEVEKINVPHTGIVVSVAHLEPVFTTVLKKYGFIQHEIDDFNEYWVPKLQSQGKPYVLFSILDPIEKGRIDRVIITPEPDTRIEVSAYFKLLDAPVDVLPMELPKTSPKRQGFTMVEWGGTIKPQK